MKQKWFCWLGFHNWGYPGRKGRGICTRCGARESPERYAKRLKQDVPQK